MPKDLPINPRIVQITAKSTINNLIDAIVEVITNSDDSYKRLEESGVNKKGIIEISVNRKKGGVCEFLSVKDYAEGMTKEKLEKAIEYSGETSGFSSGSNVRGFFGRGLKEAIIALGEGEIITVNNGKKCRTKIWSDEKSKKPLYDNELLEKIEETDEQDGTQVDIEIKNNKIKISEYENFKKNICNHYALRDILSNKNRVIKLTFYDDNRKSKIESYLQYSKPDGKEVFNDIINIPHFHDRINLKIYESSEALESPKVGPSARAGILIKTKNAILDNQLFKFVNDPSAFYFWGEAFCENLEEIIRKGEENIIDPNRSGLNLKHPYCQDLEKEIENALKPLIDKKRSQLEKKPEKEIKETTRNLFKKLCKVINDFAEEELEDEGIDIKPSDKEILNLTIKPEKANLELNKPRTFSIYAPTKLINEKKGSSVNIKTDSPNIVLLDSFIRLKKHKKYSDLWHNYFKVIGKKEGEEANIYAQLADEIAVSKVKVSIPTPIGPKGSQITSSKRKGFISDINYDETENPPQRVFYNRNTGQIIIYIKFPSIRKFIGSAWEGIEEPQGKILMAELVGEAVCKELARRGIEQGKYPSTPGGEIDSFNYAVNELQKKFLAQIQDIIFNWKF